MLFNGGTFLHYKKFLNNFLRLCAHVHNIFKSYCAHGHMIGEHTKKPARLNYFQTNQAVFFWSFLAKITNLTSLRTLPHLNMFFLNRVLKIILFN